MREIKFRGRVLGSEEWAYGNYQKGKGKHPHVISWWTIQQHEGDAWDEIDLAEVDPETVGQYTGLKDRLGKEIYEGDILKISDRAIPQKVVTDQGAWGTDEFTFRELIRDKGRTIEIIGNIYEDPELGGTGA